MIEADKVWKEFNRSKTIDCLGCNDNHQRCYGTINNINVTDTVSKITENGTL